MGCGIAQGAHVLPQTLALYVMPRRTLGEGEEECDMDNTVPAAEDTFKAKETFST